VAALLNTNYWKCEGPVCGQQCIVLRHFVVVGRVVVVGGGVVGGGEKER
jgi:hypothetical protein